MDLSALLPLLLSLGNPDMGALLKGLFPGPPGAAPNGSAPASATTPPVSSGNSNFQSSPSGGTWTNASPPNGFGSPASPAGAFGGSDFQSGPSGGTWTNGSSPNGFGSPASPAGAFGGSDFQSGPSGGTWPNGSPTNGFGSPAGAFGGSGFQNGPSGGSWTNGAPPNGFDPSFPGGSASYGAFSPGSSPEALMQMLIPLLNQSARPDPPEAPPSPKPGPRTFGLAPLARIADPMAVWRLNAYFGARV